MSEDQVWMTKEEFRDSVYKSSYHIPSATTPLYIVSPEFDRIKRLCHSKGLGMQELIEVLESLPDKNETVVTSRGVLR